MTLFESFSGYKMLTSGQVELLDALDAFLNNDSKCFLLKGYAGTGKTFMMEGLTKHLKTIGRNYLICAPTGRAAKVISKKTGSIAHTIHKSIYSNKDLKEFKVKDEVGSETFKFFYELRNNEDSADTVYIVDEASMISNSYSEGEFFRFGSGFLLNDLLSYINFNSITNRKIIFVGDNAQLPPVNMNFSPALDVTYLSEKCNLGSSCYELTQVIRQNAESGILINATNIRESLRKNIYNELDISLSHSGITGIKFESVLDSYLAVCDNKIDDDTIIIAYSNASVKEYNDFIREHFFPGNKQITSGDKVILVANNYNYERELLNGDFGMIVEVSREQKIRNIELRSKNKLGVTIKKTIALNFRECGISFRDENNIPYVMKAMVIENLLYSSNRDLSSDELKALYIDFKIRNPDLQAGSKSFKDGLRSDRFFNALRIKFGYAVTCHKAQGGEWKNVFLNCKTSMGYFNSSYYRWLYTGITRAGRSLFTIDEPHFTIGSQLLPIGGESIKIRADLITLKEELEENGIPFEFPEVSAFPRLIFLMVRSLLRDSNVCIDSIKHTSYLEHYTFSQGQQKAILKIHYNNQNKVSKIERTIPSTDLAEMIYLQLVHLENKMIVMEHFDEHEEVDEQEFSFDKTFLKDFYDHVQIKLGQSRIKISKITHNQYCEIYYFERNGLKAIFKFYYDGKGIFKKSEPIQMQSTGLVEEINKLLNTSAPI